MPELPGGYPGYQIQLINDIVDISVLQLLDGFLTVNDCGALRRFKGIAVHILFSGSEITRPVRDLSGCKIRRRPGTAVAYDPVFYGLIINRVLFMIFFDLLHDLIRRVIKALMPHVAQTDGYVTGPFAFVTGSPDRHRS